ncbi:MAG: cytidine deaminase [Limnochordaceae bacterium]|nr:cytidine deaminase [Limnochordaceae bacterium]
MDKGSEAELLEAARAARSHAYAPYSHFAVGAAVRTGSGRVFTGVNVENAAYPAGICAERVAAAAAIAAGERELVTCAVVGPNGKPCPPCGICRQFLAEFNEQMTLLLEDGEGGMIRRTLSDLLPGSFGSSHLQ